MNNFSRKFFIKNLFNSSQILNKFGIVHFKSVSAFEKYLNAGLYTGENKEFSIAIKSRLDTQRVLKNISLVPKTTIVLKYDEADILQMPIAPRIELSSPYESVKKLIMKKSPLLDSIAHWTEYRLNADNYGDMCEKMVKLSMADPRFIWTDIQIDYASFEDKPISELHRLYFYINQIRIWKNESNSIRLKSNSNPLQCWIDDELNIGINPDEAYFPLAKYIGKNGEQIDVSELNKIRQIIDMQFPDTQIKNKYLIDINQNNHIMGDYYRIPYMTSMIAEWMGE
jgi:hypothetical protein